MADRQEWFRLRDLDFENVKDGCYKAQGIAGLYFVWQSLDKWMCNADLSVLHETPESGFAAARAYEMSHLPAGLTPVDAGEVAERCVKAIIGDERRIVVKDHDTLNGWSRDELKQAITNALHASKTETNTNE